VLQGVANVGIGPLGAVEVCSRNEGAAVVERPAASDGLSDQGSDWRLAAGKTARPAHSTEHSSPLRPVQTEKTSALSIWVPGVTVANSTSPPRIVAVLVIEEIAALPVADDAGVGFEGVDARIEDVGRPR